MLAIAQPIQESPIYHTTPEKRRAITSHANDAGYYNSGNERLRLKLCGIDHINKFAVALLEDHEANQKTENEKWVYLYSEKGPVKVIVSSIANRLSIPVKDVCNLAAIPSDTHIELNPLNTALEDKIREIIAKYENRISVVKRFLEHVLTDEFYDDITGLALRFIYNDLNDDRGDPEIDALCKITEKYFLETDFSSMGKLDICFHIEEFRQKIAEIDRNYILEASLYREKINDTGCGGYPFIIENTNSNKVIVGYNLGCNLPASHGRRYAVETDGYEYFQKPEITKEHVPYSIDGKSWAMLKTHLISLYFGLDPQEIELAASVGENQLNELIEKRLSTFNENIFHELFNGNPTLPLELILKIYKFLDLPDLIALMSVNRQYRPDIDQALLSIAQQNGYEGSKAPHAYKYLKQRFEDLCDETKMLCDNGVYPQQKILYNNFFFDREILPKETFRNFKNFKSHELLELFKNEKLYIPFYALICGDFLSKRGKETLMLAASQGASDVIEQLLSHGVDVQIKNSKGNSPLHLAAYYGHEEAIKVLLKYKANIYALNDNGESPLNLARQNKKDNLNISKLLRGNRAHS